jgi:hypothetical protein
MMRCCLGSGQARPWSRQPFRSPALNGAVRSVRRVLMQDEPWDQATLQRGFVSGSMLRPCPRGAALMSSSITSGTIMTACGRIYHSRTSRISARQHAWQTSPRTGLAGLGDPVTAAVRPTRNRRCSDGERVEGGSDSVMTLLSLSFRVRNMLTCSYRFERNAGATAYGWHKRCNFSEGDPCSKATPCQGIAQNRMQCLTGITQMESAMASIP